MIESKIEYYEKASQHFNPLKHFSSRIGEMEEKTTYGAMVASMWKEVVNEALRHEVYPVVHPIGRETFSLFGVFPTGVFEFALDIDKATTFLQTEMIKPIHFDPSHIITSVDKGNINTDTSNIKTNHKNPVMVLQSQYITDGKPYCINGNHRIFKAHRDKDKQIEVYVFKDLEFAPFFYDTWSKAVYYLEIDYWNVIKDERHFLNGAHTALQIMSG